MTDTETDQRPFTTEELAERWHCSTQHIRNLARGGHLTSFRVGRLIRISAEEVERCEQGEQPSKPPDSSSIEELGAPSGPNQGAAVVHPFIPATVPRPSGALPTIKRR